jgi:uncharacterized protein YifE (UPF0438 family)
MPMTKTTKVPADHQKYLRKRGFDFGCSTAVFPPEEVQALAQYGHWLTALADGAIRPATKEQEHFLAVDRDEAEPRTVVERAWVRLKGRREFEQEQQTAPPPPPAEDYDMIEFDADRCWW